MRAIAGAGFAPAEMAGLVWAYCFDASGAATALPPESVATALAAPDGWVWLHFGLADNRCRQWLAQQAPVSGLSREVLAGPDEHLHLEHHGHEIAGVLPDLHRELGRHSETIARLRFVMTEQLLISARRTPLHAVEIVHRSIEEGHHFTAPVMLIDAIVDQFADAIGRIAQQFADKLDQDEDHILDASFEHHDLDLGRVRLGSVRVRRELGHMRALLYRLETRLGPEQAQIAAVLRGLALKLDSIEHEMSSVYERARLLQDEVANKMAAVTNRRLFTLSILTACLLPPTLVTGFFGMNTKDLPFQQTDGGTWFALLVAAGTAACAYWALIRLRAL